MNRKQRQIARRQSAITRVKYNIQHYQNGLKQNPPAEVQKLYEDKLKKAKATLENTEAKMTKEPV